MNRGDPREDIFRDDADRERFLFTLGEACVKTDWQVHATCLSDWNRIRRIQTNGYVATLAGTGESAYRDGPGGLAAFKP